MKDGPLDAAQISVRCKLGLQGAKFLLRSLVWAEYLQAEPGELFCLSKMARETMLAGAPGSYVGFVRWNAHIFEVMLGMEGCLRQGHGVDLHDSLQDPALWADYQRAMMEGARHAASSVGNLTPVKAGAAQLLDIAGSHGMLGAAICRKHPPMRSMVLDLPNAVEHARALAREAGIDDIVEHRAGDLRTDSFGAVNDVVLLSNIVHNIDPAIIPGLMERVAASLTAGGTVAIWDIETPESSSKPTHGDAFALFCWLVSTSGCFSGEQYAAWLRGAGLEDVKIQRPMMNPGQALVTGRKRA